MSYEVQEGTLTACSKHATVQAELTDQKDGKEVRIQIDDYQDNVQEQTVLYLPSNVFADLLIALVPLMSELGYRPEWLVTIAATNQSKEAP